MIELAVVMVMLGILLAMAGPAWLSYQGKQERVSASREVVSVLRSAHVRATAEETTYRVDIDAAARTLRVMRFDGAVYVQHSINELQGTRLVVQSPAFTDKAGAPSASVYFYPRGTASPGKVELQREGDSKKHTITVEGLTGRVSTT